MCGHHEFLPAFCQNDHVQASARSVGRTETARTNGTGRGKSQPPEATDRLRAQSAERWST